jgi:hypothetical protein
MHSPGAVAAHSNDQQCDHHPVRPSPLTTSAWPGAILGYLDFTVGLGIGDTDVFDFGGIISAIIGTVIVLVIVGFLLRRRRATRP